MSHPCDICGKEIRMPYSCNYCDIQTCSTHHLPESHACIGLRHQQNETWFKESLSSNRRKTRLSNKRLSGGRSRSGPEPLDSDEITTYGGSGRNHGETRSYGPDTAPDGSLLYENGEAEHAVTLDQNSPSILNRIKARFTLLKVRLSIYRLRAGLILSSPIDFIIRSVVIFAVIVLIASIGGGFLGVPAVMDMTDSENGDFGDFFDNSINETQVEHEIAELVNEERSNRSGSTLRYDDALADTAKSHSEDMADREYFDHDSPDGITPRDRLAQIGCTRGGENIAISWIYERVETGDGGTDYISDETDLAESLMDSWMNSPGHKENILYSEWGSIGVGIHSTDDNKVYATQNFCV